MGNIQGRKLREFENWVAVCDNSLNFSVLIHYLHVHVHVLVVSYIQLSSLYLKSIVGRAYNNAESLLKENAEKLSKVQCTQCAKYGVVCVPLFSCIVYQV